MSWKKELDNCFWCDQPQAEALIEKGLADRLFSETEAERLHSFSEDGFLSISLNLTQTFFKRLDAEVNELWRGRPVDLAYSFNGPPASMADSRERWERMAPYQLINPHSHSEHLRMLYLNPQIFRMVELILGAPAISFFSTFSEFGASEQLFRDLSSRPDSNKPPSLTASVALQDIGFEEGPLFLIPSSHRLPFYEFEPGRFTAKDGEDFTHARRFTLQLAQHHGLSKQDVPQRRGEVRLLHPALIRGTRLPRRIGSTRKVFTIRFGSAGAYSSQKAYYWKAVRGKYWRRERRIFWNETNELLTSDSGCTGFQNPLKGLKPKGPSLIRRIQSKFGKLKNHSSPSRAA